MWQFGRPHRNLAAMKLRLLFAAILCICFSYIISPLVHASARAPAKNAESFEASPGWAKIDLRSREAWRNAIESGDSKKQLDCLMKTKVLPSKDELAVLKSAGFVYRTAVGTIITGNVAAEDLSAIANLEFVQAIELSVPMSIKRGVK